MKKINLGVVNTIGIGVVMTGMLCSASILLKICNEVDRIDTYLRSRFGW